MLIRLSKAGGTWSLYKFHIKHSRKWCHMWYKSPYFIYSNDIYNYVTIHRYLTTTKVHIQF